MRVSVLALWVMLVGVSLTVAVVYYVGLNDGLRDAKTLVRTEFKGVPAGHVVINPDTTICRLHPLNGWDRLRMKDEKFVFALKDAGRAEVLIGVDKDNKAPQTVHCFDLDTKQKIYLREPWWRRVQSRWSACGDYTRPDYGWPVVVGV